MAPALGRDSEELGDRLLVAPAEACAERLARYAAAGVHRVFLWPVGEPTEQLELFRERVEPLFRSARGDPSARTRFEDLPGGSTRAPGRSAG